MKRESRQQKVAQLKQYLSSCKIQGIDPTSYLSTQAHRIAYTLEWLTPLAPGTRVLEVGAAPYLMSLALLRQADIDLFTTSFPYDYGERPSQREGAVCAVLPDGRTVSIPYLHINMEREQFPGQDGQFQLALCCEMLEHLARDPMALMMQLNRLLAPGGKLLLTTPNAALAGGIRLARFGHSPHVWAQYSQYGVYGRHNREFTALEIQHLFHTAGFQIERLETLRLFERHVWEPARFFGDTTFALGKKVGTIRERLPERFYDFSCWYEHRLHILDRRTNSNESLIRLCIENCGDMTWLPGQVTIGLQLWRPHNILLNRDWRRFDLPARVAPLQSVEVDLDIPPLTEPHTYYRIDLVKEGDFWFEWRGSQPIELLE